PLRRQVARGHRSGTRPAADLGKLADVPLRTIGDLLEALADDGLLRRRSLDGPGSGAILSLTEEGRRVMLEDPPLRLAAPDFASSSPSPRSSSAGRLPKRKA